MDSRTAGKRIYFYIDGSGAVLLREILQNERVLVSDIDPESGRASLESKVVALAELSTEDTRRSTYGDQVVSMLLKGRKPTHIVRLTKKGYPVIQEYTRAQIGFTWSKGSGFASYLVQDETAQVFFDEQSAREHAQKFAELAQEKGYFDDKWLKVCQQQGLKVGPGVEYQVIMDRIAIVKEQYEEFRDRALRAKGSVHALELEASEIKARMEETEFEDFDYDS